MTDREEKKGKGCLFYGCLTLLIMGLVIIGVVAYGAWRLKEFAVANTEEQPLEFSEVEVSPEMAEATKKRIEEFTNAIKEGKSTATLKLTARDINGLLYNDEEFRKTGIKMEVDFEDDKATGRISIPLGELSPGGILSGRHLNGIASLKISGESGLVVVTIDSFEVRGKPLPEIIMQELRRHNWAERMYGDPESVAIMKRIKSLEVQDGMLFIEIIPGLTVEENPQETEIES